MPSSPEPSDAAWKKLCVVAPFVLPSGSLRTSDPAQVWADDSIQVVQNEGNLIAKKGAGTYKVFAGDVENESTSSPQDVFTGEMAGNARWLVFLSADSLMAGAPWRLHVWDRESPKTPARVIGKYPGGSSNPGFALPKLRGDQLVWAEPTKTNSHRIRHSNLADGSVSTLAEGGVYAARFINDHVVAWQAQPNGKAVVVQTMDLNSGKIGIPNNPIAKMDSQGGDLAIDGEYWVLANVPSGDVNDEKTTYDIWVWRQGWPDKKKAASLNGSAYLSTNQSLSQGRLGITLHGQGAFVINLKDGIAQRVRDDWAIVEPRGSTIELVWSKSKEAKSQVSASLPADKIANPGPCTGSLQS